MTYAPGPALPPVTIPLLSLYSVGPDVAGSGAALGASATWPAANRALFAPFYLPAVSTVTKLYWVNGAAVSGNVDAGIYSEAGVRLASSGSTAQSGTSAIQIVDITDIVLSPGTYYMALACDNTTAAFLRVSPAQPVMQGCGMAQMASAFPLPDPVTLALIASAYVPIFGVSFRTVTGSP